MLRRLAVAVAAPAFLALALAACGGDGGNESPEDVCTRIETEGAPALDRFQIAFQQIVGALQDGDQGGAEVAIAEFRDAADELIDLIRDGASSAEDDDLSDALDRLADAMEAQSEQNTLERMMTAPEERGDLVDLGSRTEAAADAVGEVCEPASS